MVKLAKFIVILGAGVAISFAQEADSSKQSKAEQEYKQVQSTGATISSNQTVNLPTPITPKKPTNWSKIKDLFL
ncbi:MAG: hypothetical protein JW768_03005 [Chitinispirillaceae bacterium]|nr:hypothetical protein [Chitinispirillaceae bacterium]